MKRICVRGGAADRRFACISRGSRARAAIGAAGVPRSPPFTATLSNNTPLVFGMDVEDVSRALGEPLSYISGRPGDEIYLAIPQYRRQRIVQSP